jgi:hypothetical protein
MATGTVPSATLPPPPPLPADSLERERLIQRRLGRTSLQVRLVDLAGSIAIWAIGVVALFLVAALVDHTVGLGIFGRFLALFVLIGGTIYYVATYVVPLVVRSINPTYAARTIEEATPSLKNSLINFLLLRQERASIKEIVFRAIEQKAATDIAAVPVEAVVDRSRLIHAGYVLCVVMAVFAAYKILSPKDPFQTVARVLAPWADIVRPSRVQISDVQPGSAPVYLGQTVNISAHIAGARDRDRVQLRYSTIDGQTVDRIVDMASTAGGRYTATLPPAEADRMVPASGLQQDVSYQIFAGDAESLRYRLTVVAAPTIIVERLEYVFPTYTKRSPETIAQQGDIKALEGTKVTIHAVANQPIKLARLEFDASGKDTSSEILPLSAEGSRAWGTITLQLKPDRQTPWHSNYQVRFYNERGEVSQQPILHKIEVIPDLAPEAQVLEPKQLRVEVPEDGQQTIEVRAVDPDYGLRRLRIEGFVGGKPVVDVNLLPDDSDQPPQANVPYAFRPREHKLKAGDELKYAAVAEDNRTNPQTGSPEPNVTRTKEYTLVIVAPRQGEGGQPNPNQRPMQGENHAREGGEPKTTPKPASKQNPPTPEPKNQQTGQQQGEQQPQERPAGEQNNREQGTRTDGQEQQGARQEGQQKQGQEQRGTQQKRNQSKGSQQTDQQQGGQTGGQSDQSAGGTPQGTSSTSSGQQGDSTATGQSGGQPSGDRQQAAGQQGDQQSGASGQPTGAGEQQTKAQHDGEAFERVLKDLQKKDEKTEAPAQGKQDGQAAGEQQAGQQGAQDGGQRQNGEGQPQNGSTKGQKGGQQRTNDQGGKGQKGAGEKAQGDKAQGKAQGEPTDGQRSDAQQGEQTQAGANSGQGQPAAAPGAPMGDDQKTEPNKDQRQKGEGDQGKKAGDGQRLNDQQQGKTAAEQRSGGNEGGAPQGPTKTDKGKKSSQSKGEEHQAGAGKQGDEGAGDASEDKQGSGEGTRSNKDRPKEQKADSSNAQKGEPSPPSSSKKQSDSKGGQSGDESGGGKQGAGQAAGQEGNDSAGSKSAADEGAGTAQETGGGQTGSKAGGQQDATGKTGQSGDKRGEGSGSKADEKGSTPGKAGATPSETPSNEGEPQDKNTKSKQGGGKSGGSGQPVDGGGDGSQLDPQDASKAELEAADAANLEYARKATEMVLKRLKDEENKPDPELLEKLGWTREELAEFLRRWDALQKSAQESTDGKRELDEALRSLGLRDPANRKRAGGKTADNQRDLRDAGGRSTPPAKYRNLFDAFRKGAARSRE